MTDRIHSLTVTLERDIRDDDIEPLVEAIQMLRGVLDVQTFVADPESHMAEMRAKDDLRKKLFELVR